MKKNFLIIIGLIFLINTNLSANWKNWERAIDETVKYVRSKQRNQFKNEEIEEKKSYNLKKIV